MPKIPLLIRPQLATLVSKPPSGPDWVHEPKLDGYRLIVVKKGKSVHCYTRRLNDWTHRFKTLAKVLVNLPFKDFILDGEVVVQNQNGLPDFQKLQNSLDGIEYHPFKYFAFDLIYFEGKDLRHLPLIQRKAKLKKIFAKISSPELIYCDHYAMDGKTFFEKIKSLGLEGMISKQINSPYVESRSRYWLKTKCKISDEFVVCGYTNADDPHRHFGSLFLAKYENKKLKYCGNVGTGFNQKQMQSLLNQFQNYVIKECPFEQRPPDCKKAVWMQPKLIAEVEYSNMTDDKLLRHPSFKGIREDKINQSDLTPQQKKLNIQKWKDYSTLAMKYSNKNNFIYPKLKICKDDVIQYYQEIKPFLFKYINNRILNLYRIPKNYTEGFYQRYAIHKIPSHLQSISLMTPQHKIHPFFYVDDNKGYMMLPALDAVEVHIWASTINDIDHPDFIVFDIDPGPNIKWKKVIEAAFDVKELLAAVKLKSYVKTTGGKGLHIVVPLKPKLNWHDTLAFSKAVVEHLVEQKPKLYVKESKIEKRNHKIYIDYLRNVKCSTMVAPYSLRARANGPVSVPLYWDELSNNQNDTDYNIKTIFDRLNQIEDPWEDFFDLAQEIKLGKF